jgi:hypothetical protein
LATQAETTGAARTTVSPERRALWRRLVKIVIASIVVMDFVLSAIIFASGDLWFDLLHGTDYVDPQGLLKRTGALWLSFGIFQAIAYFRWQTGPHWLLILAGFRFGDLFSDWTYWFHADDLTWLGHVGLLSASPGNLLLALFFYRAYFVFRDEPAP